MINRGIDAHARAPFGGNGPQPIDQQPWQEKVAERKRKQEAEATARAIAAEEQRVAEQKERLARNARISAEARRNNEQREAACIARARSILETNIRIASDDLAAFEKMDADKQAKLLEDPYFPKVKQNVGYFT